MITRWMFMAYAKGEVQLTEAAGCRNVSLFSFGAQRFLYAESDRDVLHPDELATGEVIPFPDGTRWVRLMEVFHYAKPLSEEHWARRIPDRQPLLRTVYLHPEKVSSYIFYHFQLQEERHEAPEDKYGMIFVAGNQLVMYEERPAETDDQPYPGMLNTHQTPGGWQTLMGQHFAPWPDDDVPWRPTTLLQESQKTPAISPA